MKAFPNKTGYDEAGRGMDLRDYFAAKAMQGFLAEGTLFSTKKNEFQSDACAYAAYEWANSMMKARNKK